MTMAEALLAALRPFAVLIVACQRAERWPTHTTVDMFGAWRLWAQPRFGR